MSYLFALTFFMQMFGLLDGIGPYIQMASFFPIFAIAGSVIYSGDFKKLRPNWVFWFFSAGLALQSMIVTFFNQRDDLFLYSFTYILVSISLFLSSVIEINRVINSYLVAILAFGFCIVIFDYQSVVTAFFAGNEIGIYRLSSFDNHPNLLGHVFALGILLSIYRLLSANSNYIRISCLIFIGIIAPLLLLTSSRGAMVSLAVALVIWFVFKMKRLSWDLKYVIPAIASTMICFALAINYWDFLSDALDINSQYRGLDSGLTGRSDNWPDIVYIVFENPNFFVHGSGFRSWSDAYYGFATDNSYVNFLFEFGFFSTVLLIFSLLSLTRKIIAIEEKAAFAISDLFFMIVMFSIVEGLIARYLIAIGNPGSLFFLLFIFHLSQPQHQNVKLGN